MPHILVTNDDGYQAPALALLARALRAVGQVTVFAPDHNWSAAGHTKTMHKPLRITKGRLAAEGLPGDDIPMFVTTGTPSDCVALALLGVVETPFDLVVSGINVGASLGHDVTYSGTVAAAMEGAVIGRPAIAASMEHVNGQIGDLEFAAEFIAGLSAQVLQHGLPRYGLLNVNFPALPRAEVAGVRITRLGIRVYHDVLIERLDPKGQPYYWIGGEPPTGEPEEGTDIGALACGNISITPLNLDMTGRDQLAQLSQWPLQLTFNSGSSDPASDSTPWEAKGDPS